MHYRFSHEVKFDPLCAGPRPDHNRGGFSWHTNRHLASTGRSKAALSPVRGPERAQGNPNVFQRNGT
ncbi:hypothetical protein J2802_004255 [Paraburkholderia caribensis]|jgi:hypothetical protein|nr:hypothetical protein [Paraburkholderia caribensis]